MVDAELAAKQLESHSALDGLAWVAQHSQCAKFSSAFGEEDQVITHLIATHKLPIRIFTLDTGRLFDETLELIDITRKKYQIPIDVISPDRGDVEEYVRSKGINGFYESIENRKACCHIRKVKPLRKALSGADVWVTGLRAEQSADRKIMKKVEWDARMNLIKYNPLLDWNAGEMKAFIEQNSITVNQLHKKGFASIGCAPCTRAIQPGEDLRAGRWWWESSKKECGLHAIKE